MSSMWSAKGAAHLGMGSEAVPRLRRSHLRIILFPALRPGKYTGGPSGLGKVRISRQRLISFCYETSPRRGGAVKPRAQALGLSGTTAEALKGRSSWLTMNIYMKLRPPNLRRPFRAFYNPHLNPRAHALGFPARPLRGPEFRNRN